MVKQFSAFLLWRDPGSGCALGDAAENAESGFGTRRSLLALQLASFCPISLRFVTLVTLQYKFSKP
jgi:hypothetical protein